MVDDQEFLQEKATPVYYTGSDYYSAKLFSYLSRKDVRVMDPARYMAFGRLSGESEDFTRAMGGLQVGGGLLVLILIPEPTTTVGGLLVAATAFLQVDNIQAGLRTMGTGEYTRTLTHEGIAAGAGAFGKSPEDADRIGFWGDLVVNVALPMGAHAHLSKGPRLIAAAPEGRLATAVRQVSEAERQALRLKYKDLIEELEQGLEVIIPVGGFKKQYEVGIRQMMADLTTATGREVGLWRMTGPASRGGRGGLRALTMGTEGAVFPPVGNVRRLIAHTHPSGALWFSQFLRNGTLVGDKPLLRYIYNARWPNKNGALSMHGYRSVIIAPGGEAQLKGFGGIGWLWGSY